MKKITVTAAAIAIAAAIGIGAQDTPQLNKLFSPDETIVLRGQAALSSGSATVTLPAWFEGETLAEGRSVQLTCRNGSSLLSSGDVANGQFTVTAGAGGSATQSFWWEVKGIRRP